MRKFLSEKMPYNFILVIDLMALLLLYLYNNRLDPWILLSGAILTVIIYLSNFFLVRISNGDHYIFLIMTMLMSIGIIVIYRINPNYGFRQIIWFGIGMITFFLVYRGVKRTQNLKKWTKGYLIASLVLFLATLLLGAKIKGAINWIHVGRFTFQPAEIIKILFVFFLASYYTNNNFPKNHYLLSSIVYGYIGFLFLQKDLGTAMIFFFVFIVILYIFEEKKKYLYIHLLLAFILGMVSLFFIYHVKVRIVTWMDPWLYVENKGYQITQSLFAIASGGFFGTGIGLGHPEFIPEVHTDFIFSAICEEMGIFGGIAVILLFFIFVYRGFKIAMNQNDLFFKIVALGITTILGFQSFIIIGGVIKMIPLTGVTLPFVSYGGSSLVSSFISIGILQVASEEEDWAKERENG